jgi:TRAP-type mannitol/chloroaromatic compound transport system permease small subunit
MEQFIFLVDKFNTWIGKAFGWCILLLTTAVAYEVFVRYLLNDPTSWAFDMSYMMYGSLFMMGGAYTLARDGHVRGDVIYRLWPAKVQASVELVLYFLLFFPGVLALIMAGTDYAGESWSYNYGTGEVSINSPANVPISQFKTVLPVAAGLLFLQGIAQVCRCIVCLKTGAWPAHLEDVEEMETILQQHHEYEMAHKAHEDDAKGDAT